MRLAIKPRSLLNVGRGVERPWAGPRLAGPLGPHPGSAPTERRGLPPLALKRFFLSGAQVFSWGWWWLQGFAVCGGFAAASWGKTSMPRPAPAVSVGRLQALRAFRYALGEPAVPLKVVAVLLAIKTNRETACATLRQTPFRGKAHRGSLARHHAA